MLVKRFLFILLILITSYFFLYKIYIPRVSAFGCFDDCFSYAAGYFLNNGKILYTDIFYNHQMLPAYISSVVQSWTNPINIFDLVLKHRQFVIFFSFLFNFLFVLRFGLSAFLFFIFFELTKFYIFGDRFLGEALAVYPLVFLVFISWSKLRKTILSKTDYILSAISAWLVIYLRETFIPLALILFLYLIFPLDKKLKRNILLIFSVSLLTPLLFVNIENYLFELVTVNKVFISQGLDIIKIIFYPLFVLTGKEWNIFRTILIGVDLLFIFSLSYLVISKRKLHYLLVFIPLILSNLRPIDPGKIFYSSFHMIPFYGIFLVVTFLLLNEVKKYNKNFWLLSMLGVLLIFLNYIFSPNVFFKEKINTHEEFFTNYSNILQIGEISKKISKPSDTLFLDGYDEVIYWGAQRSSSYKFSMYTSFMPNFKIYSDERVKMFKKTPPDFYYGSCPKETSEQRLIPAEFRDQYLRLNSFGKPSCVFVRKDKLKNISDSQWRDAKEMGYELP